MYELLSKIIDREVDVVCAGASSLRGKIVKVEAGVLQLRDEGDNDCYVAIDKTGSVSDRVPGASRPLLNQSNQKAASGCPPAAFLNSGYFIFYGSLFSSATT